MYPKEYLYSTDHEWVSVNEDIATIGITDYAQHELGDVVFVDLPEVGDTFESNEPFGSVESVKAVSEIFCPVRGEVIEINDTLDANPELINESPHERAWMIKLSVADPDELNKLMSAEAYEEYLQEQS
ncbi:MAG: glycine cleavage system protein GcvH [Acidobacteriota bacterium]